MKKFKIVYQYLTDFTGDIIEAENEEEAFDKMFYTIADDLGNYLEFGFEEINEGEDEENV